MLRLIPFECNECTYCGARKDKEISVRVRRMVEYSFLSFANLNKKQEGLKSFLTSHKSLLLYKMFIWKPNIWLPKIFKSRLFNVWNLNELLFIVTHIIHLKINFLGPFYLSIKIMAWLSNWKQSSSSKWFCFSIS